MAADPARSRPGEINHHFGGRGIYFRDPDDHLMEISHVARGEEWLPSVPKHLLLYDYLGAEPPEFIHLPLLRNPDRTKLSKRRNPTSLSYFRKLGFLPEAMVNFLGLAFVAIGEGDELMDFDALAAAFDPAALSLKVYRIDAPLPAPLINLYVPYTLETGAFYEKLHIGSYLLFALLPLAGIHYWRLFRPTLLPYWGVLLLGVMDWVSSWCRRV